jgi:pyruvate/2-oxoglutarate dehydrogenase complex dihydrolipoamide dehydrogenase (E3) component
MRGEGMEVLLQTDPVRVERGSSGGIRVTIRSITDGSERTLSGSHLLAATGRAPNTATLNLAATGVNFDKQGFISADERLQTNVPGIYALGDVKGGPAFTHISYDDWRIVRANLLESGDRTTRDRLVPYTVFTDPQLGRVGLSETEARAQNLPIRVAKIPMSYVARAIETDETRGLMKAVVHAETAQILGFAALAVEGGELMNMVEIAMLGKLPYTTLKEAIFAHPTFGESLNTLFMELDNQG